MPGVQRPPYQAGRSHPPPPRAFQRRVVIIEHLGLSKEELEEAMQPAAERLEALIRELLESSVEWRSEEHDN